MAVSAKDYRNIAKGTTLTTGALLIGILPALGITLTYPLFGALNVGVLLGFLQLLVFWAFHSRKV